MAGSYQRREERDRHKVGPDPEEQEALADAAKLLNTYMTTAGGKRDPETLACVAISGWIISRSRQVVGLRLREHPMLSLGDARLRGWLAGALPTIATALEHLPADKPFFDLSQDEVVDVLVAGIEGARVAAVAAGEAPKFPFDDGIPFG